MAATLRSTYIPRLFDQHFSALKQLLLESTPTPIHITADETTDCRDHSILNVLASFSGKTYLIDVVKMEACNHSTFNRVVLKAVAEVELPYERICGVVTDSAAYCKKAYWDILSTVFPNSTHVLCLAHIVNLAADVFQKIAEFRHVCTLISTLFF